MHVYINVSVGYSSILFSESVGKLIRIDVNMDGVKASIVKEKKNKVSLPVLNSKKYVINQNILFFYARYFLGSCYCQH